MNIENQHITKRVMHIFKTYGVRSLTIDAIAMQIPISKKDLLKFAKNKEELISKIFEFRSAKATEISNQIQENPKITNTIDVMIHMSILMSRACNEFNPQLDFEFKKYYPALFSEYEQQKQDHILQSITGILMRGQFEKVFKPELEVSKVAQYHFEQVQKYHESIDSSNLSRETIEQMIQLMSEFIYSICTPQGANHYSKQKELLHTIFDELDKNMNV